MGEWKHHPDEGKSMTNDCLYCHREITFENYSFEHVHYCTDCVQYCIECGELKGVWCFGFDYKSDEYKIWKGSGCYGKMTIGGHLKVCGSCERNQEEADKKPLDP